MRLQRPAAAGRRHQGGLVGGGEPVPAALGPGAESGQHRQGLRAAGANRPDRGDECARQRRLDQGHARTDQRPGGVPEIHPGAKPVAGRVVAPHRRLGKLSAAQIRRAVPRPAIPARRDGESNRRRAQPLHQVRAGIQHDGATVSDEPHRDDLQDERQAELHRRRRGRGQRSAEGRFREGIVTGGAGTCRAFARRASAGSGDDALTGALPPPAPAPKS